MTSLLHFYSHAETPDGLNGKCCLTWSHPSTNRTEKLDGFLHQSLLVGNVAKTTWIGY
jgi:hypothetical protein